MKNWKSSMLLAAVLVMMWPAQAAHGQSPQPQTNSVKSSPSSDTDVTNKNAGTRAPLPASGGTRSQERAGSPRSDIVTACNAAVEELKASRVMIASLENENSAVKSRLETEKRTVAILTELNETRKSESDALRAVIAAKNETITARDAVIAAQDKLIAALKTKKPSPWRRIEDVLLGAGIFAVLR